MYRAYKQYVQLQVDSDVSAISIHVLHVHAVHFFYACAYTHSAELGFHTKVKASSKMSAGITTHLKSYKLKVSFTDREHVISYKGP